MKVFRFCTLFLFCLLLSACENGSPKTKKTQNYLINPRYAIGFHYSIENGKRVLYCSSPRDGRQDQAFRYTLCPRDKMAGHEKDLSCIPVPLKRVICLSSTHIAFIDALDKTSCIVGVSGSRYISNARIQAGLKKGEIRDVGYDTALDYERIIALQPDAVFAYGIRGESLAYTQRLMELGIRVIYIGDYLETHPLGKAEYVMAFAPLFDALSPARSFFKATEESYRQLQAKVAEASKAPGYRTCKVMANIPYHDVWYIPGGRNHIARFVEHAGGRILGCRPEELHSGILSTEKAYILSLEADVWLFTNDITRIETLRAFDHRFKNIPALQAGRVFNNNLRQTPGGGSDFWESGVTHPQEILSDLIAILHPELLPDHNFTYFVQLK